MIHLSAGELLRKEMNTPGSKVAAEIETYIKSGTIVPVAITCSLLHKVSSYVFDVFCPFKYEMKVVKLTY